VLLRGKHSWVPFDQIVHGQLQAKPKLVFFVMHKIHRNSNYIYNASQQSQWQTHKCARSRLCCRQTFLKFLTWMEIKPKHHKISGRTSYRNTFSFKTMVQMESLYSKGFPLWLSTQQISRTPNRGKPQTRQQFRIRNIYITRPVWSIEKLAEFNSEIISLSKPTESGGDISLKTRSKSVPSRRKARKCAKTPVMYNGSARPW